MMRLKVMGVADNGNKYQLLLSRADISKRTNVEV